MERERIEFIVQMFQGLWTTAEKATSQTLEKKKDGERADRVYSTNVSKLVVNCRNGSISNSRKKDGERTVKVYTPNVSSLFQGLWTIAEMAASQTKNM